MSFVSNSPLGAGGAGLAVGCREVLFGQKNLGTEVLVACILSQNLVRKVAKQEDEEEEGKKEEEEKRTSTVKRRNITAAKHDPNGPISQYHNSTVSQ